MLPQTGLTVLLVSDRVKTSPLSGLLYVLSGEPLVRALNKNIEVRGFRLPSQEEVKMIQHVDDKTLMLNSQSSIIHVLNMVEKYGKISGSKINKQKSFIIKFSSCNVRSYMFVLFAKHHHT